MIGVTLRYKWITWAMFRFPVWSPSSPQGGYHKNVYLSLGSGSLVGPKTHSPLFIIF
jgi:hypothetical protein